MISKEIKENFVQDENKLIEYKEKISLLELYPYYTNLTFDIASYAAKDVKIRILFREKIIHTTHAIITEP